MKYKLDVVKDVDVCEYLQSDGYGVDYILHLPFGFRFSDDLVHVRGYDSLNELKQSAKSDVIPCDCKDCKENM